MNPITHFLASWSLGDAGGARERDLSLVSWCGVMPDLDGLGAIVDETNRILGRPDTWYFGEYHHIWLHGLPGAIAIPLVMSRFAVRKARTFILGFTAVHLHILCDIVGSRGPEPEDIWPIHYLAPFTNRGTIQWPGQWALNAWPNVLFTALLLAYVFHRAVVAGYSPVGVFNAGADRTFVETVRARWARVRQTS